MTERWLPVPDWEHLYEVSDEGRVRSLTRIDHLGRCFKGRILKPGRRGDDGRTHVMLSGDGRQVTRNVATLVALAFLGPREPGTEVCHNDGDPGNSMLSNLRYDTHGGNMQDMRLHGTNSQLNREECRYGHAFDEKNTYWTTRGTRECRTCRRDNSRTRIPGTRHPLLTEDRVREIRRRVAAQEGRRELAREFGIGYDQVNRIVQRRSWAHVE